jgi:hypothetical protein
MNGTKSGGLGLRERLRGLRPPSGGEQSSRSSIAVILRRYGGSATFVAFMLFLKDGVEVVDFMVRCVQAASLVAAAVIHASAVGAAAFHALVDLLRQHGVWSG